MLDSTTTMFIIFGAVVVSQIIGRRALNVLTPEQKVALVESSPKIPWLLIFIAVAYGIQSLLSERLGHSAMMIGGFMIVLICGILLTDYLMFRRFQRLGLPPSYLRALMIGKSFVFLAMVAVLWSSYSSIRDIDASSQKSLDETTETN